MIYFEIFLIVVVLFLINIVMKLKAEISISSQLKNIDSYYYSKECNMYRDAFDKAINELNSIKVDEARSLRAEMKKDYIPRSELTKKANAIIKLDRIVAEQSNHICEQANYIKQLEQKIMRLI